MRKTLASAALASATFATCLATLALYLNPGLVLRHEAGALGLSFLLPWTAGGTVALALVAAAAASLRWWPRPFRPVVEGWPFLASLTFLALGVAAALYWHNLLGYRHALPVETLRALAASSVVVTGSAVVLVAIGLDLVLFPRRERSLAAALAVLAPAAAVAVPLALRPEPEPSPPPTPVRLEAVRPARRVVVVGVDGLGPSDVAPDPASGRVSAFARLARRGAFGRLATLRPTEGPPLWTTMMTGRLPRDHGILSASVYRLRGSASDWALLPKGALVGGLERLSLASRRPVASTARRRRALWNVLDAFGIPAGLVRVWGTHPPETIRGFVLSPYFHLLRGDPARAADALFPRDLLPEVAARAVSPRDLDPALLADLAEVPAPPAAPLADPELEALARDALAPDLTYARAAQVLAQAYAPSLLVVSFQGYDTAGHSFYRYAHPEAYGDVAADQARRYGRVLDRYASLLERWVSDLERGLLPGDVLVVVSGHGLVPTPLWRRLLGALTGTAVDAASHSSAPDGVLLIVGQGIRPGSTPAHASVLDVAPTLLYLMGLPVARDMEGRILTEILDPDFARDNPVTFIPSYESLAVAPAAPGAPLDDLPPLPEESR
ncbi:MAG TPA: alkaline phosphatase family protein [Vicinamibacteria bacterium]|nr:alkaline phosphatase family protein [Vicinamibacteria bacterium]